MCVIACVPAGKQVPDDWLDEAARLNGQGFGFSYVKEGTIFVLHTMEYDVMKASYKKCIKIADEDSPFLLHWRIATAGAVDESNCHPFVVSKNLVVAHNGVINDQKPDSTEDFRSDTSLFVDNYLRKLPREFYKSAALMELIRGYIGGSKLAFLTSDKQIYIVNSDAGIVEDGIWWSNTSARPVRTWQANKPEAYPKRGTPPGCYLIRQNEAPGMVYDIRRGSELVGLQRNGVNEFFRPTQAPTTGQSQRTPNVTANGSRIPTDLTWSHISGTTESSSPQKRDLPLNTGIRHFMAECVAAAERRPGSRFTWRDGEPIIPSCRVCQHYGQCCCSRPPGGDMIELPDGHIIGSLGEIRSAFSGIPYAEIWTPQHESRKQEKRCLICRVQGDVYGRNRNQG